MDTSDQAPFPPFHLRAITDPVPKCVIFRMLDGRGSPENW